MAVVRQVANELVDLLQGRRLGAALDELADSSVVGRADVECGLAALVDLPGAMLLDQREHPEDLAGAVLAAALLDGVAECADVFAGVVRAMQQLSDASCWPIQAGGTV